MRVERAPPRGHDVDRVRLDRLHRQARDAHARAAYDRDAALALVAALRPHLRVAAPRDDLVVVGDQLERHRPRRCEGRVGEDLRRPAAAPLEAQPARRRVDERHDRVARPA